MSPSDPAHQPAARTRSRLRRLLRWKLVLPAVLLLLLLGAVIWRQSWLWRMPDIGDPFPVSELLEPIPTETNAYPLFEEAYALLVPVADEDRAGYREQADDGWDPTDDLLNKYLELNRPALEKWREATERDDFQIQPVLHLTDGVYFPNFAASRDLIRWSHLEIERLVETNRPAAALPWLQASFRASALMTRNEPWLSGMVALPCFAISVPRAEQWMQHPEVTEEQLLQLLSMLQESIRLMERPSKTVKMDHIVSRREYEVWSYEEMKRVYDQMYFEPPFNSRFEVWFRAEPEFSRRLVAHMTLNHLQHVDTPRRERPALLEDDLFDTPLTGFEPDGALDAAELLPLLKTSRLLQATDRSLLSRNLNLIDRHEARYACLQVALAAHAYHRRHGEFPERLAALQPEYLAELPDDPYSPEPAPVVYRRTGNDAVVYSRYTNGQDDGGSIEGPWADLPDFGLRIRTPNSTRPVAAPDR